QLRPDVQHLRRVARPDAGAQRRLASDLHDAAAVELLPEYAPQPRLVLLRLDDRERGGLEEFLPALHAADQRLQEHGQPRHDRYGFGIHLENLRLRLYRGARAAARGGLLAARGDSLGDDVGRGDAVRTEGRDAADGHGEERPAGRFGDRRREPAQQPEGAVRNRPPAAESSDETPGESRRRQVHDQERHRLRRAETARGSRRIGRRAEADDPDDDDVAAVTSSYAVRGTAADSSIKA